MAVGWLPTYIASRDTLRRPFNRVGTSLDPGMTIFDALNPEIPDVTQEMAFAWLAGAAEIAGSISPAMALKDPRYAITSFDLRLLPGRRSRSGIDIEAIEWWIERAMHDHFGAFPDEVKTQSQAGSLSLVVRGRTCVRVIAELQGYCRTDAMRLVSPGWVMGPWRELLPVNVNVEKRRGPAGQLPTPRKPNRDRFPYSKAIAEGVANEHPKAWELALSQAPKPPPGQGLVTRDMASQWALHSLGLGIADIGQIISRWGAIQRPPIEPPSYPALWDWIRRKYAI